VLRCCARITAASLSLFRPHMFTLMLVLLFTPMLVRTLAFAASPGTHTPTDSVTSPEEREAGDEEEGVEAEAGARAEEEGVDEDHCWMDSV
jgi:hypothetical protein